jgi:hypothetical protein
MAFCINTLQAVAISCSSLVPTLEAMVVERLAVIQVT